MTDLVYPDIEAGLIGWFPTALDVEDNQVGAETPGNLDGRMPFHKVARIGGRDKDNRLDEALVSVDVYAASRGAARDGCEAVRTALLGCTGTVGDCVVLRVQTLVAPSWRPYENTSLRRYGATFRITFH